MACLIVSQTSSPRHTYTFHWTTIHTVYLKVKCQIYTSGGGLTVSFLDQQVRRWGWGVRSLALEPIIIPDAVSSPTQPVDSIPQRPIIHVQLVLFSLWNRKWRGKSWPCWWCTFSLLVVNWIFRHGVDKDEGRPVAGTDQITKTGAYQVFLSITSLL